MIFGFWTVSKKSKQTRNRRKAGCAWADGQIAASKETRLFSSAFFSRLPLPLSLAFRRSFHKAASLRCSQQRAFFGGCAGQFERGGAAPGAGAGRRRGAVGWEGAEDMSREQGAFGWSQPVLLPCLVPPSVGKRTHCQAPVGQRF